MARSFLSTGSGNGGGISIYGEDLEISGGSQLSIFQSDSVETEPAEIGNIKIDLTGNLFITEQSGIRSRVLSELEGGDIRITARGLTASGGIEIGTSTFHQGNSGNIIIDLSEDLVLQGNNFELLDFSESPILFSIVRALDEGGIGGGNAGDIIINAKNVDVSDGAQINLSTRFIGDSGNLFLTAEDTVQFSRATILSEVSDRGGVGTGGDINITTRDFLFLDGSSIRADTESLGNAGNIHIVASDNFLLSGEAQTNTSFGEIRPSNIFSSVERNAAGNGGNIKVEAGSINLLNSAEISVQADGISPGDNRGRAGSIDLTATELINLAGDQVFVNSGLSDGARGEGGNILLTAPEISISDEAQINLSTAGQGNAGQLQVIAGQTFSLTSGGNIFTEVTCACETGGSGGMGRGGDINIQAQSFRLGAGSNLRADTEALGNAGNITIDATDQVLFEGGLPEFTSGIFSQVES